VKRAVWASDGVVDPDTPLNTSQRRTADMGFMDSIRDALGGDKDDADARESAPESTDAHARHVDRDAPAESAYGPQITGGKHAARD
jgi:hypothetical protein